MVLAMCSARGVEADSTNTLNNSAGPKVIKIWGKLGPGSTIGVVVTNLAEWAKAGSENDPAKLVPLINGRQLSGLYPLEVHSAHNLLRFRLAITEASQDTWTDLLRRPTSFSRPASFTVGLEGGEHFKSAYPYGNKDLKLTIIPRFWGPLSLAIIFLIGIVLVCFARRTDLIRDVGPRPPPGKMRPYNLGLSQMAFWFFLVLASYVVVWLITGNLDTITPSLLALMGISAGTALGDTLIDSDKTKTEESQRKTFHAEKNVLERSLVELDSHITEMDARRSTAPATVAFSDQHLYDNPKKTRFEHQKRLELVNLELQKLAPTENEKESQGFWQDVLSDGHGYSIHRFQIVVWTLVLGIIFVSSVYDSLRMPEFSTTLLGLMGISAGTYVAFKHPEK